MSSKAALVSIQLSARQQLISCAQFESSQSVSLFHARADVFRCREFEAVVLTQQLDREGSRGIETVARVHDNDNAEIELRHEEDRGGEPAGHRGVPVDLPAGRACVMDPADREASIRREVEAFSRLTRKNRRIASERCEFVEIGRAHV